MLSTLRQRGQSFQDASMDALSALTVPTAWHSNAYRFPPSSMHGEAQQAQYDDDSLHFFAQVIVRRKCSLQVDRKKSDQMKIPPYRDPQLRPRLRPPRTF